MRKISAIFVSQDGFMHELIGSVVRKATGSQFSHVALGFDDCIIEAIAPKVQKSPLDKYDGEQVLTKIELNVTDEQYNRAYEKANALVGLFYGLDDCLIGGIRDVFGDKYSDIIKRVNNQDTIDCSATYTTVMRDIYPEFIQGQDPCEITPEVAYRATIDLIGGAP